MDCPKCGKSAGCKDGIVHGKQRYLCRDCNYRYSVLRRCGVSDAATRRQALELYLEGLGFRSIGRILKFSHVAILKWIQSFGEQITEIRNEGKAVEIMELDEMHSYIGSKKTIAGYGLLLIEMEKDSSIVRWVPGALTQEKNSGIK
jgi:transposase-like protein